MSELTTMTMAVHRVAVLQSEHPVHAMAYDLALEKRLRRGHWWQRVSRPTLAGRHEAARRVSAGRGVTLSSGC